MSTDNRSLSDLRKRLEIDKPAPTANNMYVPAERPQHELVRVLGCTITVDTDMLARHSVDGHRVDAATFDRVLGMRKYHAEQIDAALRAARAGL